MKVHLISKNQAEVDLYFSLLSNSIAIDKTEFTHENGEIHTLFLMDFKKLQKTVTNKRKKVTLKQDLSVNTELVARVGLYRNGGLSFQKIADKMNAEGFKSSRKNKLNKMQVHRLYQDYRAEEQDELKKDKNVTNDIKKVTKKRRKKKPTK